MPVYGSSLCGKMPKCCFPWHIPWRRARGFCGFAGMHGIRSADNVRHPYLAHWHVRRSAVYHRGSCHAKEPHRTSGQCNICRIYGKRGGTHAQVQADKEAAEAQVCQLGTSKGERAGRMVVHVCQNIIGHQTPAWRQLQILICLVAGQKRMGNS